MRADETEDWAGVRHARARGDVRIASLVPSLTELLFALGLGHDVVARTGFCVHPRPAVRGVPKIGGTKDPDLARLRALAPTHLLVNVDENRREVVEEAATFVQHVVVTDPRVPDDNLRLYRLLGAVFAREDAARSLCDRYVEARTAVRDVVRALPRERVLYLIWKRPWMSVRRDTYVSATLDCVGFDTLPAEADRRYPEIADDAPAWRDAQRILLSSEPYAFRQRDVDALARAQGRPVDLVDGQWTSWYGVRAIEGLRSLAAWRAQQVRAPPSGAR
jgi:ABC-type Fe3+-hydroxamate transport system substrate-binding protein